MAKITESQKEYMIRNSRKLSSRNMAKELNMSRKDVESFLESSRPGYIKGVVLGGRRYLTPLIVCLLAFVAWIPQFIIHNTLPPIILNDSVWYLDLTRYFAQGGFFPDYYAFSKPIRCMINYPFGYPLFLDFCRLWGSVKDGGALIVLFQHFLSLCSVVLIFFIGRQTGRVIAGFCAAVAYAIYSPRVIYVQAIMAETLLVFLTLLSIYLFFVIMSDKANWKLGVLLGLIVGYSITTKPLALLGAGMFILYFLIIRAGKKMIAGFTIALMLIISANLLYNRVSYNELVLTTTAGTHLANRVFTFDHLLDENDPATQRIISQCKKSGLVFRFPGLWWKYLRALRSDDSTPQEADKLIMKAAIAALKTDPFKYFMNTFVIFMKNIFEEDRWIDIGWFLTPGAYNHYLKAWSTYQAVILPPGEYRSRQKVLETMALKFPDSRLHDVGIDWMRSFDNLTLKWRGWVGWAFLFSFGYAFLSRDIKLLFISSFIIANLMLVALTEAPFSRYFESFAPLAMLLVFLSFAHLWNRIRAR